MAIEEVPEETVSVRYVRALIDAVEHRAVSRARFLTAADWDSRQLHAAEGRIRCSEFYRLCELGIELTGDPALGLHTMQEVQADSVDLVGHLAAHASTVRRALESQLRLHKLLDDRCRIHLVESDRYVTLRYDCPDDLSACGRRFAAEMHMRGIHLLFGLFSPEPRPKQVNFEHAAPPYRSAYERVFMGAERFDQPVTSIVFEREVMDARRRYRDEEYYGTLCRLAESRVARLGRGASSVAAVLDVVAAHTAGGKIGMGEVAQALGISTRSLRRRLAAEGASFDAVLNEALAAKARHLLTVEKRTVQQTADDLGYSDRTAFHRAFKRWTGTTPRAWRTDEKPS